MSDTVILIGEQELAETLHELWAPFLCTGGGLDMDDHRRQARSILDRLGKKHDATPSSKKVTE